MDCRRSVMGLTLLFGLAGCLPLREGHHELVAPDPADEPRPESELPKRQPKAKTCVEYGRFHESEANAPNRSPADRERLLELARKMYQQALDIDRKNLPAALALARLYDSRGDHDRAVTTYQKALKFHAKDAVVWGELGMCHARHKEWDPALKCLRKAVDLDPENRQAAHTLGYCLARAGRYEECLVCFTQTDGEAKAHYNLARMLLHMQQGDLGREHLRLALEKDPRLTAAQQLLADVEAGSAGARTHVPVSFEDIVPASQEPARPTPDVSDFPTGATGHEPSTTTPEPTRR